MTARKPKRRKQLLTEEQYEQLLRSQDGGCAICGNPPKTRKLHTDHDHLTGRVRGLLCYRCNRALPTYVTADWLTLAWFYVNGSSTLPEVRAWLASRAA